MADSFDDEEFDDNDGPAAEGEPLPVIGKATALYQFEGALATYYCYEEFPTVKSGVIESHVRLIFPYDFI